MADSPALTLIEAARAIARREISALALTEVALERIACDDPTFRAFLHVEPDAALAAARAADAALARGTPVGPLHGVPIARKDNLERRGERCTAGSRVFADRIARRTAVCLSRLDAAGAIDLGGTNLAELAFHPHGCNSLVGPPRLPQAPERVAGGSSGGSAAALAAHFVFGAIGTDSGGSIRSPAALCGVVGLMPSARRVSRDGLMIGSATLDRIGPMARTVADCARLYDVVAVQTTERGLGHLPAGLRLGVLRTFPDVAPEVAARLVAAAGGFAALGVRLVEIERAPLDVINEHALVVFAREMADRYAELMREQAGVIHPEVLERLRRGAAIERSAYFDALAARDALARDFAATAFGAVDVLLLPAAPAVAPLASDVIAGRAATAGDPGRYTRAFNYLDLPALVLPAGVDSDGLPIGMQLVGRPGDEAGLLALGHAFESLTSSIVYSTLRR